MATRLPFILCTALCNRVALTAPNPPPPPEEQAKYKRKNEADLSERSIFSILNAAATVKQMIYILNIVESLAIVTASVQGNPARLAPIPATFRQLPNSRVLGKIVDHLARAGESITPSPSFAIGVAMAAAGALLRYVAYRQMGRQFTFQLSVRDGHRLVKDGPYAWVRHPSYTGTWIYATGVMLSQLGPGSYWAAAGMWGKTFGKVYGVAYLAMLLYILGASFTRCPREDAMMRKQFGAEWDEWARVTRYRLFPGIY